MKVIAVDDEKLALKNILMKLQGMEEITTVTGFATPEEALEYLKTHSVDVAFLDINMRHMNGIELAEKVRQACPRVAIIFLTGYSEYAVDAFRLHASGYLMKPAGVEDIRAELAHVKEWQPLAGDKRIFVQTFGNFEVFADGKPVPFTRNKSKELLAYLVDRRGARASMAEIASVLWEDGLYDRSRQKQMQTFVSGLNKALEAVGASEMVLKNRTGMMVDKATFDCDFYRFLDGNEQALNAYTGEYMSAYWWGESTIGVLNERLLYAKL